MTHKPCPECVRACIESLPAPFTKDECIDMEMQSFNDALSASRRKLEALLPDKAEELVREWLGDLEMVKAFDGNVIQFAHYLTQNYTLEKK